MKVFTEAEFADWVGRRTERQERITSRLISHFAATLDGLIANRPVPLGLFWALVPDVLAKDLLGRDGHPRLGLVMPPLPLPRRMWAGGELVIHSEFQPDQLVTRTSVIEKIAFKQGASGPLGFVTLRNQYLVDGAVAIEERQDIVYRGDSAATAPVPIAPELGRPRAAVELTPDSVLLFRYSALTFNGHRIHYDHPYATEVEGYDGLVVHGPLQAILMLNLAAEVFGKAPARFSYRGVSPLTCGKPIRVEAFDGEDKELSLRVRVDGGPVTMSGRADG